MSDPVRTVSATSESDPLKGKDQWFWHRMKWLRQIAKEVGAHEDTIAEIDAIGTYALQAMALPSQSSEKNAAAQVPESARTGTGQPVTTPAAVACGSRCRWVYNANPSGNAPYERCEECGASREVPSLPSSTALMLRYSPDEDIEHTTLRAGAEVIQRALANREGISCSAVAGEVYRAMLADDARYTPRSAIPPKDRP